MPGWIAVKRELRIHQNRGHPPTLSHPVLGRQALEASQTLDHHLSMAIRLHCVYPLPRQIPENAGQVLRYKHIHMQLDANSSHML